MKSPKTLNKWQRIKFLEDLNINTEHSILVKPGEHYLGLIEGYEDVSVRTFKPTNDNKLTPHIPVLSIDKDIKKIDTLLNNGYYCIIALPRIDPKDCLLAGCIYFDGSYITVEYVVGQYTTRKVTHQGMISRRIKSENISYKYNLLLNNLKVPEKYIDLTKLKLLKLQKIINDISGFYPSFSLEFSIYKMPIGNKKDNLIIWEITE